MKFYFTSENLNSLEMQYVNIVQVKACEYIKYTNPYKKKVQE